MQNFYHKQLKLLDYDIPIAGYANKEKILNTNITNQISYWISDSFSKLYKKIASNSNYNKSYNIEYFNYKHNDDDVLLGLKYLMEVNNVGINLKIRKESAYAVDLYKLTKSSTDEEVKKVINDAYIEKYGNLKFLNVDIFNKYQKEFEDASYTSKRGRKHHGYKIHIATDTNSIIKEVITTTAKTHDSTQFDTLTKDETKAVFADSGYMSQERKRTLRSKGIFNGITERRVRGQSKLRTKQSKNNTKFSKVRALVELPFAFIKKLMKYTETKYLGLHKNSQHVFLIAAAYNLRRMPNLIQRCE